VILQSLLETESRNVGGGSILLKSVKLLLSCLLRVKLGGGPNPPFEVGTTKFYPLLSLRMNGAVPPLPIRHRDVTRETFFITATTEHFHDPHTKSLCSCNCNCTTKSFSPLKMPKPDLRKHKDAKHPFTAGNEISADAASMRKQRQMTRFLVPKRNTQSLQSVSLAIQLHKRQPACCSLRTPVDLRIN
jgi:hypothetical protein